MRYFSLLFSIFFFTSATAQDKWDLRRCVEYAMQNNINVLQQDVQAKITTLTERQAKNSVYPNVNLSTNLGLQSGRSVDVTTNQFNTQQAIFQQYNVNADMMVFNWHRVKSTLLAAQLDTKAAQANVEKAKNDIALSVATQYLQALLNQEQIEVSKVQFEQTKSQLDATRLRVKAGSLPELNASELEAQLARDSTAIINARAMADISKLQLKALLNLDAAAPFELDIPPVEKIPLEKIADLQPDYVYQMALANQPAQKLNKLRLQSSQMNVKVSKAYMYPSISAFAALGSNFSSTFKNNPNYTFAGYIPPTQFEIDRGLAPGFIQVGTERYYLATPQFGITQTSKSFGQLWQGYGTQLNDNFRQNVGLSLSIPIFSNGGAAKTAFEKSKLTVKSAELTIQQADQQLKQDIYQAYTNALSALQRYNATEVTVTASQKTYDFAKKRYDVGLLGTFELITNQNNLNTAIVNRLLAQYEYVFRMKVLEFYKGQGLKL